MRLGTWVNRIRCQSAARAARPRLEPLEARQLFAQTPFDTTFGDQGRTHIDIAGLFDAADLVRAQGDGSLLLAGRAAVPSTDPGATLPYQFSNFLIRLTAAGAPEPGFGENGVRLLNDLGTRALTSVRSVAIDSQGRILAAGLAVVPALAEAADSGDTSSEGRNTGASDTSSSPGDDQTQAHSSGSDHGASEINGGSGSAESGEQREAAAISGSADATTNGRNRTDWRPSVSAEDSVSDLPNTGFAVLRLNPDGSLDTTFGEGGITIFDVAPGQTENLTALTVSSDGMIVAGGTAQVAGEGSSGSGSAGSSPVPALALARLSPDGSLDASFGDRGIQVSALPPLNFLAGDKPRTDALVAQQDGSLLVAGRATYRPVSNSGEGNAQSNSVSGVTLVRYTADGTQDLDFGDAGFSFVPLTADDQSTSVSETPAPSRVIIQSDGRIVASAPAGSGDTVGVVRLNGDGTVDPSFGSSGRVVRPGVANGDYAVREVAETGELEVAGVSRGPAASSGSASSESAGAASGDAFSARLNASGFLLEEHRSTTLFDSSREDPVQADFTRDGKIVAVGSVAAVANAGEGEAVEQSKDVLVVRLNTATLDAPVQPPTTSPPTQDPAPTPATPPALVGQAKFSGKTRVTGGKNYTFKVAFTQLDDAQGSPCVIVIPGGATQVAEVTKYKEQKKKGTAQGAYRFTPDDGRLDLADNGHYQVRYRSGTGAVLAEFDLATKTRPVASAARNQAVLVAIDDAAARLGVKSKVLNVESAASAVFDDLSLGYPRSGESYDAVDTPGFIIVVTSPSGDRIEYHADASGQVRGPA